MTTSSKNYQTTRKERANAIRALAMDAVQLAGNGHPGAPMGMADIAEVLWNDHLKHNPNDPLWPDRDRFVLSNGHGSMLLYSLLHLSGYDLSIDDLKNFRQLHSKTPGHPEFGYAPGIETTTGPLGQGLANAVGMALAEKVLSDQFNRPGHDIVDHFTYVFMGDGCLMEGISHEVCSLAGTLRLGKLIAFYDDNGISIDGEVEGWFSDDTPNRFKAYGWHVISDVDGHDDSEVHKAIESAKAEVSKPTIICCKTTIGYGSPNKQGKEACHGAPLGAEEIVLTRKELAWNHPPFEIPDHLYLDWSAKESGKACQQLWEAKMDSYAQNYPDLANEFNRRISGELPDSFLQTSNDFIHSCQSSMQDIASRKASQNCLNAFGPELPELLGGSADLAGSNLTLWAGSKGVIPDDASGNYIFYGVREFGMSAIMNGVALHKGFLPYGATFLMFMEYARNAVRMAALMKQRCIFVYTHDSIGLGEDGPTHQPVEQLTSLRSTPNLFNWRPCDTVESAVAWQQAILRPEGPTTLIFSRQSLPHQTRLDHQLEQIQKGGYILLDGQSPLDAIIIATGSEVGISVNAARKLQEMGHSVRVVSMPCTEAFLSQDNDYKESVIPSNIRKRIAVEALHKDYWYKFVGLDGIVIGMESFGESAPASELMNYFEITEEKIISSTLELINNH
ncbi:transketolase [Porticoccus sp. W117]|uniref:transketolase n=1 Tax=Porticoccus sp. W117 TaxID=3054777 RepID=UPI00259905B6|nr:transketolase [Porticoccus sp. W117]MDM3872346.1 transketolase [Porticoccus sp. W117]